MEMEDNFTESKIKFIIMKKYIVYLTTNTINNKIYVGVHGTDNPDVFDGYLGCGITRKDSSTIKYPKFPFELAVKKYGFDAFKRATIKIFDTMEEALDLEAEIVNEEFIKRSDTYNIALGGGLPPILSKAIYLYDLNGKFIKEWKSITEASKDLNISMSAIGRAINFKRTSGNYLWSDCKFELLDIKNFNIYSPEIIVYLYNANGTYEKTFKSMLACCSELKVNLSNVLRGIKTGIMVKGYYVSDKLQSLYVKPKHERLSGVFHQYDLNGIYIKSFNSISDIDKEFGLKMKGINDVLRQGSFYFKNYLWSRGEFPIEMSPYKSKTIAKKIGQYTLDNELIKVYNTLRECRKDFPNVSKVLNGLANHCHGYKFKYV